MKAPAPCRIAAVFVLVLASALTAFGQTTPQQKPAKQKPAPSAAGHPCPNPPPCKAGHDCSNYPYHPTDCWTTSYGPAPADVIIPKPDTKTAMTSPNMLYCEGNTYALCFFSGPSAATGKPGKSNAALPCVPGPDGTTANCTCQAYTSGPNFVDINGILNRGAYFETVNLCGQDGGRCKNIEHCWPKGDGKKQAECQKYPDPPVCKYLKTQSPTNPQGSLMPNADLISTFSFAMSGKDGGYQLGSTPCAAGLYAGCMTAACHYRPGHKSPTTDGELVQCDCPTYNGVFQVGQADQSCSISPNVWSASNTVTVDAHVVKGQKKP
jgi:hypothetical protein